MYKNMVDSTKKKDKKSPQNRNATWKTHRPILSCVFGITSHTNLKPQHNDMPLFPYYGSRADAFIPAATERTAG